jgi:hypothetical protein
MFDFAIRKYAAISASIQGRRAVEDKKVLANYKDEESKKYTRCISSSRLECIPEFEPERIVTSER